MLPETGLEGFGVRQSADDENMLELADDSVQGFFDHRGNFFFLKKKMYDK